MSRNNKTSRAKLSDVCDPEYLKQSLLRAWAVDNCECCGEHSNTLTLVHDKYVCPRCEAVVNSYE